MTSYTEKLERYLHESELSKSSTISICSAKKSNPGIDLWPTKDTKKKSSSKFTTSTTSSNSKSANKKSPIIATKNQKERLDLATHTQSISIINSPSASALSDITNSKRLKSSYESKPSHLLGFLPSELTSFNSEYTIDAYKSNSQYPNKAYSINKVGAENQLRTSPLHSSMKPARLSPAQKQQVQPTLFKKGLNIEFSRAEGRYNIEDFLPDHTYLKANNYIHDYASSSSSVTQENNNHDNNFTRILSNMTEKMHIAGDNTIEYNSAGYGSPNFLRSLNTNTVTTMKNVNQPIIQNKINQNEISQINSSITEEQQSHDLSQSFTDSVTQPSVQEGRIDEKSKLKIKNFVKDSLIQVERPKDLTSNEYADFLSKILIRLIENFPQQSTFSQQSTQSNESDFTSKTKTISSQQSSDRFYENKSPTYRTPKLQIQKLESINYIPDSQRYRRGSQERAIDATPISFKNNLEASTTEKPPKPNKINANSNNDNQEKRYKSQSNNENDYNFKSLINLSIQDDELSDSSLNSTQGHIRESGSKCGSIAKKKNSIRKVNSTNKLDASAALSETIDSDFDFEVPKLRFSISKSRVSVKQDSNFEQNGYDKNQRLSSARRESYKPSSESFQPKQSFDSHIHSKERCNKDWDIVSDSTARFNADSRVMDSNQFSEHSAAAPVRHHLMKSYSQTNVSGSLAAVAGPRGFERSLEKSSNKESSYDTKAVKRSVFINENNEVVFTETAESNTSRSQYNDSKGSINYNTSNDQKPVFLASKESRFTLAAHENHRSYSPNFDSSKDSSRSVLSKAGNDEWSPSKLQLEYSISNSHVSRMNSIMFENQSRMEQRSARDLRSDHDNQRHEKDLAYLDPQEPSFNTKRFAPVSTDNERGRALNIDDKPSGWKSVRFSSRENIEEFLKNY